MRVNIPTLRLVFYAFYANGVLTRFLPKIFYAGTNIFYAVAKATLSLFRIKPTDIFEDIFVVAAFRVDNVVGFETFNDLVE